MTIKAQTGRTSRPINRPIVATYRLQLHNGFNFADVERILPYLRDLGVSHLYLSPIFTACSGSTHGYDIADPTTIDPILGGEPGFRALAKAAHAIGLGILLDIVPNHLGVGQDNPWWQDLLRNGASGFGGRVFDVDWEALTGGTPGKVSLPILGDPIEAVIERGELVIQPGPPARLCYFDYCLPLADDDASGDLASLLERQHWRLVWWRTGQETLNWRRFFDITDLAGVRVEDGLVFERSHALVATLLRDGLIDGLRLDHVDGLADPGAYLRDLDQLWRQAHSDLPWILIEKITGPGEKLPGDWHTDGTTGYDTLNQLLRLFIDPNGIKQLNQTFTQFEGKPDGFEAIVHRSKRAVLEVSLRAELDRLVMRLTRVCDIPPSRLRDGLIETIIGFPYYRTYGEIHRPWLQQALAKLSDQEAARAIERALAPGSGLLTAFEQLSGPAMAKSLEDTAFYRWHRLIALNEVGGEPHHPTLDLDAFHDAMTQRARDWPKALTATATHDTKRGEDTRLRIACLSQIADEWDVAVSRWCRLLGPTEPVTPPVLYFLFQSMIGIWPQTRAELPSVAKRLQAYAIKALREAKEATSWLAPNTSLENHLTHLIATMLTKSELIEDVERLMLQLEPRAQHARLAQTMLKLTLPGVPDIYQGTEAQDYSLVDPDNRRPVPFADLADFPKHSSKQQLTQKLLHLRQDHQELFSEGTYEPVAAPLDCIAFRRRFQRDCALVYVQLRLGAETSEVAGNVIELPCGWVVLEG